MGFSILCPPIQLLNLQDETIQLTSSIENKTEIGSSWKQNKIELVPSINQNNQFNLSYDCYESTEGSSYEYFSPIDFNLPPKHIVRNIKPTALALDIQYLSEEEFKIIPKYMLGRLSCEVINRFVDVINDALSKKYTLLSKPKSSLKPKELGQYLTYKKQEVAEIKGRHFVSEEDVAFEMNKKTFDKKSSNIMVILRHTKRITEHKQPGYVKLYLLK